MATLFGTAKPYRIPFATRTWLVAAAVAAVVLVGGAALGAGILVLRGATVPLVADAYGIELVGGALLLWTGTVAVLQARRARLARLREERFPDFVRDLAISRRAGLSLPAAVTIAARGDHGELTPLVMKMAAQLESSVSFMDAFKMLAREVDTPLVRRLTALVEQANRTGGSVSEVLLAASRDARTQLRMRSDRVASMQVYVAVVYVAFAVFLLITLSLYLSFLPTLAGAAGAGVQGLGLGGPTLADYRTFYFAAGISQAIGHGLVIGVLAHGRAFSGMVHASLMILVTTIAFGAL